MNLQSEQDIRPARSSGFLETPQLSIVVASVCSHRQLETWLDTLAHQAKGKKIETIVADGSRDDSPQKIMAKYRDVIFIRFPRHTTLPILWDAGIARSTGKIITLTDSTSIPDEHWISSILQAHAVSHPVIGGAVEVRGCKRLVDWAAYFCEYGQFMRPLTEGVVKELPGNNISFKRWALEKGREFVQEGFWKTYWCRKLQEEGIELISVPSIVVYDKKSYRLMPFLVRRFHHGRCFAGMRAARLSLLTRIGYLLGSPILPFLFLKRTISAFMPKRRYGKEFILSLPISILAIVVWSVGEFCGYIAGSGKSCAYIY